MGVLSFGTAGCGGGRAFLYLDGRPQCALVRTLCGPRVSGGQRHPEVGVGDELASVVVRHVEMLCMERHGVGESALDLVVDTEGVERKDVVGGVAGGLAGLQELLKEARGLRTTPLVVVDYRQTCGGADPAFSGVSALTSRRRENSSAQHVKIERQARTK